MTQGHASSASAIPRGCARSCSASSATATAWPASPARSTSSARSYLRDVQPGEIVSLGEDGLQTRQVVEGAREAFCVFEYIYFARPDSRMGGHVLQAARGRMGEILAREAPAPGADLVIAVPDSGNAAARGVRPRQRAAAGRRLRQEPLRRADVHPARPGAAQARPAAEVQPAAGGRRGQAARRRRRLDRARQHDAPDRADAARRGRARGAHAHLGAADPHPCHYGIDMSTREEMIAHDRTVEEVAARAGVRHARLPLAATASTRRSAARATRHCDACFSGDYPLEARRVGERQVRARAAARPRLSAMALDDALLAARQLGSQLAIMDAVVAGASRQQRYVDARRTCGRRSRRCSPERSMPNSVALPRSGGADRRGARRAARVYEEAGVRGLDGLGAARGRRLAAARRARAATSSTARRC